MIHAFRFKKFSDFFKREDAGGITLITATVLALIIANSPVSAYYDLVLKQKDLTHWINDGLMVIFFFLVGLEIKREVVEGKLSSFKSALLPFIAATGGIIIPALIFYIINMNHPVNLRGWAIPTATDIAFSLGLLALLGSRVPTTLKILLTAIAIIDDLAAILVIAVFYTQEIHFLTLGIAALMLAAMMGMNFFKVKKIEVYLMTGFLMWAALLTSGIHPTIAGVATAFCIPFSRKPVHPKTIDNLIHHIHPFAAFFILPVFAFANAGVSMEGITFQNFLSPLTLGIGTALVFGKFIGISLTLGLLYALPAFKKPSDLQYNHIIGLGFLCGIGFTMSLFIGDLAFYGSESEAETRLGILLGSFVSALCAFIALRFGKWADNK